MRNLSFLFVLLFAAGAAWAQSPNHSSIQKLQASYRIEDASEPVMLVTQHMHVELNEGADVQKIHVLVKDAQTGNTVYQVSYTGSATQTDANGLVLFERTGNTIEISNPATISLMLYTYELSTENSAGQTTELFTDNQ